MTDNDELHPSGEAQDPTGHLRENASDPGPSDVPTKSGCLVKYLWAVLIGAGIMGLSWAVASELELFAGGSEASNDSATESTITDQGAVSSESASDAEGSGSNTAGPISGTWAMYWEGSDNRAFEITFTGSDTGTLEILNDDTESLTSFTVEGDQVRFKFTRTFEGTLTGLHEMTGTWARQDWECSPDGCKYGAEWSPYDARLIRISE